MTYPRAIFLLAFALAFPMGRAVAQPSREAFAKAWEGRTVVVKRTLYTLVYNERGRLGSTKRNRRAGLTVVTPFEGTYLQFDGRQSQDDIRDHDPQRLMDSVSEAYRSDALDIRQYQKVEPVVLARYEPGSALTVSAVRIEHDTIRLSLNDAAAAAEGDESATALTVKWPTPLSKVLSERDAVERLIAQFVEIRTTF